VQQIRVDMMKFARCMRSHGVPRWPDPVVDHQGRGSFDTAGIDTSSPRTSAEIDDCNHVYPANVGIPWAP
jgi:hypothetical protein